MAINQYFELYDQDPEKELLGELHAEAIKIYGFNMFYLPRKKGNLDSIFGEDTGSYFDKAYEAEMYLKSTEQFGNNKDFIGMVGLEIRDTAVFTIARNTFDERLAGSGLSRPREGDIIYFPLKFHNNLFEIKYITDEDPFYQAGGLYVWDLKVEVFEYSDEKLRTGIPAIDDIEDRYVASVDLVMGAGSGNFKKGELVYQGLTLGSAFIAEVISWTTPNLRLKHTKGSLINGQNLTGNDSGAVRTVTSSSIDLDQASTNEPFQDNKELQDLGDDIVQFDTKNPFGSG